MHDAGLCQIRPYSTSDAEKLYEAVEESREHLSLWLPWCHPDYGLKDSVAWVDKQVQAFARKEEYHFVIGDSEGRLLGACGLNSIDGDQGRANLGYWVRKTALGKGVATAAVRLLVDWAFSSTALERLEVLVAVDNFASLRVAEKAGALREGRLYRRLRYGGQWKDAFLHVFLRTCLEQKKERPAPIATLHLLVGPPGVGKSTLARGLGEKYKAITLSNDAWMRPLFGSNPPEASFLKHRVAIEDLQRELARVLLGKGVDLVWDYGVWTRLERSAMAQLAVEAGARLLVYRFPCSKERARARVLLRSLEVGGSSLYIDAETFEVLWNRFEPLQEDEGYEVVEVKEGAGLADLRGGL